MAETLAIVGAFVACAVWMMRTAMRHHGDISGRFIRHLEETLAEQQEENRLIRSALRALTGAVRRNSRLLQKLRPDSHRSHDETA